MNKHDLHSFKMVWLWKRATALVTTIIFPFSAAVFAKHNFKSGGRGGQKGLPGDGISYRALACLPMHGLCF